MMNRTRERQFSTTRKAVKQRRSPGNWRIEGRWPDWRIWVTSM